MSTMVGGGSPEVKKFEKDSIDSHHMSLFVGGGVPDQRRVGPEEGDP